MKFRKYEISCVGCLVALFAATNAAASPYLTADPQCYDGTGANAECPLGYEYSGDNGATWLPLDASQVGTAITIWSDLSSYAPGPHELLVRGYNSWGVSDDVPFDFTAGVPVAPTGLKLVAPAE